MARASDTPVFHHTLASVRNSHSIRLRQLPEIAGGPDPIQLDVWSVARIRVVSPKLDTTALFNTHALAPQAGFNPYRPRPAPTGFEISTGADWPTAIAASGSFLIMPSAVRKSVSIWDRTSGLSFRNWRAFSRPWPMRSPPKLYQEPLFSTMFWAAPRSIRSPSREMPSP